MIIYGYTMTERERKLKKRIQLIVAASMAVFFCLLVTLTVQLAIRGNQRKMENSLRARQTELLQQIEDSERNLDYISSQKFVDEYALKELGYGKDGAVIIRN